MHKYVNDVNNPFNCITLPDIIRGILQKLISRENNGKFWD